jgi:hypothetical protein
MLLVAVAVALTYPQEAADPAPAVPVADGLTADLRHHHGHISGGYGAGYNQGYGGYNQGYGGYNQQGYSGYNQGHGNDSKYQNSDHLSFMFH